MKKEIAALLLLAALFGGALYYISYMDGLAETLTAQIEEARACTQAGDFKSADRVLRGAIKLWMSSDGYTHIFIRHPEIDSATDAFYELLSDVDAGDGKAAGGAFDKAEAHLSSIASMEHIKIGSIL